MHRAVLLTPLLALAVACNGSNQTAGGAATPAGPSTESPQSPPVTVFDSPPVPRTPPASTSSPRIRPPTAAPTRPATTRPALPVTRPAAPGDVDGDGKADQVRVAGGTLTVVLSGGGTVTSPVAADGTPRVVGVVDVDRDGRAEVFLQTAAGASTVFYTPFRYDGQTLRVVVLDGQPVRLGVGGSVTHGDGFACTTAGRLVVRQASTADGATYRVDSVTYGFDGAQLVPLARTTETASSPDDPRVHAAYSVDCGPLGEGG